MSKQSEVRNFLIHNCREAVKIISADMRDRAAAEVIRQCAFDISLDLANYLTTKYKMAELHDIFEWKTRRVRR